MSTKKNRSKIKFCYEDYRKSVTAEEFDRFKEKFAPLVDIIMSAQHDAEVLERAKHFDADNGTDIFSEAVNFTIYCIACHRVDCTC